MRQTPSPLTHAALTAAQPSLTANNSPGRQQVSCLDGLVVGRDGEGRGPADLPHRQSGREVETCHQSRHDAGQLSGVGRGRDARECLVVRR